MSVNGSNDFDLPSRENTPKLDKGQNNEEITSSNEEDVYNVEKLCDHKYNAMSEGLVDMYWQELQAKGILKDEIMNPSKIKKRPLSTGKAMGSVKESAKKRTLNDSRAEPIELEGEAFPPEDESWESYIDFIEAIDRVPEIGLMIYVKWKSGKKSVHPSSVINKRCPQKIIKFYEERLRFTGVPQE
ncbi:hypothetical protein BB561_006539 [Smittium simulii]|uniref:Chromo shadow domain-containing protein n=1 Tax=Smittium simulii TaxID=133385 RepID=A0A2T9Y368_9FUNG|nr:hypothetical protein BB561_006539 [Smittium simulii]